MLHVSTYLMGATCLKQAFHERGIAVAFDDPIMGNCVLSDATVGRKDFHAQAILGVAGNVSLDSPSVLYKISPHQGIVTAVSSLVEKLFSEGRLGCCCLSNDKESAGIFVNTVHQSHLGVVGIEAFQVSQMPRHSIDKRPREVTGTGMYNHSGRLIDDHEHVIFVDNFKRNVFGNDARIVLGSVEHERNHIAGAHLIVALYGLVVHMNEARISCLLNAIAALIGILLSQEPVNTHRSLPHIHHYLPVFIELLCVVFQVFYVKELFFCHGISVECLH